MVETLRNANYNFIPNNKLNIQMSKNLKGKHHFEEEIYQSSDEEEYLN
jgi:hypothetical protein